VATTSGLSRFSNTSNRPESLGSTVGRNPPELHGVKSRLGSQQLLALSRSLRLAPSGEPARSSRSALGLPSPELDPRSLAGGMGEYRTPPQHHSQRSEATAVRHCRHPMDQRQHPDPIHLASPTQPPADPPSPQTQPDQPTSNPNQPQQFLLHSSGISPQTSVGSADESTLCCTKPGSGGSLGSRARAGSAVGLCFR